jgi:hypothetical protein
MLLYRSRLRREHFKRDEVGSNVEKRHLGNIPSIQVRDAIAIVPRKRRSVTKILAPLGELSAIRRRDH